MISANDKFRELYVGTSEGKGFTDGKVIEYLVKHWTQPMQERAGEKIAELLINNGADVNQEHIKKSTPCDEAGNLKKPTHLKYNLKNISCIQWKLKTLLFVYLRNGEYEKGFEGTWSQMR